MYKVTVLLSGGIDSSVLLALLNNYGLECTPIFIDYGQVTAEKEYMSALEISKRMELDLEIISAPEISKISVNQLTNPEISQNPFYPNRNLLLLTLGSIYAYENKQQGIAIGAIKALGTIPFPDINHEFFEKFSDMVSYSLNYELSILTPFIDMSKKEVVEIGKKLGVPLESTYSCLVNNKPCEKCESCLSRKEALGVF